MQTSTSEYITTLEHWQTAAAFIDAPSAGRAVVAWYEAQDVPPSQLTLLTMLAHALENRNSTTL